MKTKKLLAMIATAGALVMKGVLYMIGVFAVPVTDARDNPLWGNKEESAPDWYQPGWKEVISASAAAGVLWAPVGSLLIGDKGSLGLAAALYSLFFSVYPEWQREYLWRAFRNPVNNLRYRFTKPEKYAIIGVHDPEGAVRGGVVRSATREIVSGPYYEYWRVWRVDGDIAEIRIGWKFSPVEGFAPTLQWRKGA